MKISDSRQKTQALVFLHVPKTGGRTLSNVILRQFDPDSVFTIGLPIEKSMEEFKNLPESKRAQFRLLEGHIPFGLHTCLPNPSTYITLLREPVDRVFSIYYYILRTPQHYLHNKLTTQKISLKEFVASELTTEIDNGQTRLLSGVGFTVGIGKLNEQHLEDAKRNIKTHFTFAGLTERFDESLLELRRIFGWRNIYYEKKNVAKNRPSRDSIDSDTIKKIKERHQLDLQLYQWVKDRLDERIQSDSESFQRELKTFRFLNQLYMRIYSPSLQLPRTAFIWSKNLLIRRESSPG